MLLRSCCKFLMFLAVQCHCWGESSPFFLLNVAVPAPFCTRGTPGKSSRPSILASDLGSALCGSFPILATLGDCHQSTSTDSEKTWKNRHAFTFWDGWIFPTIRWNLSSFPQKKHWGHIPHFQTNPMTGSSRTEICEAWFLKGSLGYADVPKYAKVWHNFQVSQHDASEFSLQTLDAGHPNVNCVDLFRPFALFKESTWINVSISQSQLTLN